MILLISNATSDVLALRVALEKLPFCNASAVHIDEVSSNVEDNLDLSEICNFKVVILRRIGGASGFEDTLRRIRQICDDESISFVAVSGEKEVDPELIKYSNVSLELVSKVSAYLNLGGGENVANCLKFVMSCLGLDDLEFDEPFEIPEVSIYKKKVGDKDSVVVGVIFYRAQYVSGNTFYIDKLLGEIELLGAGYVAIYCYSLRGNNAINAVDIFRQSDVDVIIATIWAAGSASEDNSSWDPSFLSSLDVPIIQGIVSMKSRHDFDDSPYGLSPIDVAMSVALIEFDGRIVGQAFAFKEEIDNDEIVNSSLYAYRVIEDRVKLLASTALKHGKLRKISNSEKRVGIVLSAYPTKRSRIGNAVGLDTPLSLIYLLKELKANNYAVSHFPESSDDLMFKISSGLTYGEIDSGYSMPEAVAGSYDVNKYMSWFNSLPNSVTDKVEKAWGSAPGEYGLREDKFIFTGLDLNNVKVAVQPPRGFGLDPIAVYHSPDLPPTHHYLAFYCFAQESFDALIHLGKHGTLEWLPGKSVGLSSHCFPDLAINDLPLIYPFVVNDPGEGCQAKRRTHAVIVDHLVPPMTKAELKDEFVDLEMLLDEYARYTAVDPGKLPLIREKLWSFLIELNINKDLALAKERLEKFPFLEAETIDQQDDSFDDLLPEIDGYLCELKDSMIRGGLHVLGRTLKGEELVDFVIAVMSVWQGNVPPISDYIESKLRNKTKMAKGSEIEVSIGESQLNLSIADENNGIIKKFVADLIDKNESDGSLVEDFIVNRLLVDLSKTGDEISAILKALDGKFIDPGPSGAPTRGMANVLPTGRNFYSIDPQAVPSRIAYEVGKKLADGVIKRHRSETQETLTNVAIVLWGTANMRTSGDDVAEILAFIGVKPKWDEFSNRVCGLELISVDELKRARVDVTVRISGFFRDAFPHVITLLDEAFTLAASSDDGDTFNPLSTGDDRRVFGPKPESYGSGILNVIDSSNWNDDSDLLSIYLNWGGYSYSNNRKGDNQIPALAEKLKQTQVAIKNQDNREHDIFDSDDYFQDHGGMIAAIRTLRGSNPLALFGDSSNPNDPKVKTLKEEALKVVRSRVLNSKWIGAMMAHGYKGAFEMAATVDYMFGYDATGQILDDWVYEGVTERYIKDRDVVDFYKESNPFAYKSIAERLLEAYTRGMWNASEASLVALRDAILEAEAMEEGGFDGRI